MIGLDKTQASYGMSNFFLATKEIGTHACWYVYHHLTQLKTEVQVPKHMCTQDALEAMRERNQRKSKLVYYSIILDIKLHF